MSRQLPKLLRPLGFLLWSGWLVVWTVGLLRTEPISLREAVIPDGYAFVASKSMHIIGYTFLASWPAFCFPKHWRWIAAGCLIHGITTEFLQPFCGRNGSVLDVGWDGIGIGLGVLFGRWANGKNRKLESFSQRP